MKTVLKLPLAFALVLLSACALLGVPTPESFSERLAVGYSSTTTVRQTALTLLQQKKLSPDDVENIQQQADNARAGLDIARTMRGVDLESADARLTATLVGLTALEAYLRARQ